MGRGAQGTAKKSQSTGSGPGRNNLTENVLWLINYVVWHNNRRWFPWFGALALWLSAGMAAGQSPAPPALPAAPAAVTNSPASLNTVVVTADLDAAREQIAPSLGAVTYTIGANQIAAMGQGENASFQQVLLQAPGVVQEEFGEIHVRGDHGDLQYRINGVLLPESLNGFGQEIDPHLIHSVTLITGTLPAQFGDRTAGIIDVTTKAGYQLNGAEFSLYGGSYDTFHPSLQLGGTTSNLDYFVAASYLHDDLGIDNTTASPNPLHDRTDQEKLFGYFSHHFDQTSRLTLLLSSSYADFQIPDTAGLAPIYQLTNGPPANSADGQRKSERAELLRRALLSEIRGQPSGSSFSSEPIYGHPAFSPDPAQGLLFGGNAARVVNSDFANGLQADASYELGDHHTLRAGLLADYDLERLNTDSAVFPGHVAIHSQSLRRQSAGTRAAILHHSGHARCQQRQQRVHFRHLPAGRVALDRSPHAELRRALRPLRRYFRPRGAV